MFDNIRKNIGITLTRFSLRKKESQPVQFSNAYTSARSALIILPENQTHRSVALPLLTLLHNKFQGNRLTIVTTGMIDDLKRSFSHSSIVSVGKDQMNMFFLPKRSFFKRLVSQRFDVLVDLNFTLAPVSAYFCRTVQAQLKVGFVQNHADAYYNFQINAVPDRNPKSRYDQLFRTLSMF